MNDDLQTNAQSPQTLSDENSLQSDPALASERTYESASEAIAEPVRPKAWRRIAIIALLVIGVVASAVVVTLINKNNADNNLTGASSRIKQQSIALADVSGQLSADIDRSQSTLTVNGQVVVDNSLVLQPTTQPTSAVAGQIYYDQTGNSLLFYNGTQFLNLLGSTVNTQVTNTSIFSSTTNIFGGGGGVAVNNGTTGSIAMFTSDNEIGDSLINQANATITVGNNGTAANTVVIESGSAGTIQIGNSASSHNIQIGTGAGVQNTSLGSGFGTSSTTIQGGTGNLAMTTGAASGVTGSISITSGDSSTTASGNITIDAGVGIIDGEVVEHKTFEGGVDNMQDWFNTTITPTTAQAHSGLQSLQVTPSSQFWGIIEVLPGTPVTPGHQYHFSIWARAASTPRTIGASLNWQGTGITSSFTSIIDSTTGWTEMTLTAPAPAGATAVSFEIQTGSGAAGDVHYFDDIEITDLSSGTAVSAIELGSVNAKIVTIGNLNQIGATTIRGGSGINIQSGAATTTINGGVLNMTGNAASTFNTTSGALTITSATSTTWSVGSAGSGVGGNLTLHAGRGGDDGSNDGGDLILQGGARSGAASSGSVIVKPPTDTADAFQIQNSTGSAFFLADSTGMTISVAGTDTAFAKLQLSNAHFNSTQTTPPTIGVPANCGTTPSTVLAAGSTDTAGAFTITTGTGGTASTCDAVITFHQAYGAAPKSILVVGKTNAASAARQPFVSASNASSFTVSFGQSAAGADNTAYDFSYWVIE